MKPASPTLAVMLAASVFVLAQAQTFGHHQPPASSNSAAQRMNCNSLPPGSGMDKATCESMNAAAASWNSAQTDPSASRPGDDAMTCDQIKAELMGQNFQAPDQRKVQQAQASTSDFMAKTAQLQAEATTVAATETAENLAAGAASAANPLAGKAAQEAINAQETATQAALNAQAKAELTPRYNRAMSDTGQVIGGMTSQMAGNPRMARLMQLAGQKNCH